MDNLNLLKGLGITDKQLKSIDSEAFEQFKTLNTMFNTVSKVNTPQYLKNYYNTLVRDFKAYTSGEAFRSKAKTKGVNLISIGVEEEISVAAIPKVKKSIAERIADKKASKKGASVIIPPTVEVVPPTAEEPIEEPIEEPTVMPTAPIIDEGEVSVTESELFGFRISNTNNVGSKARSQATSEWQYQKLGMRAAEKLSAMLAYGGWDYNLLSFQNDKGNHFKLELYDSLCKLVISTPNTFEDSTKSLMEIMNYGFGAKTPNNVTLNFIGANKDELMALKSYLDLKLFSDVSTIPTNELSAEKYTSLEYIEYNTSFSPMLSLYGSEVEERFTYYTLSREIKLDWDSKGEYLKSREADVITQSNIRHGLLYSDYVYEKAERLYKRKGETVVVKKITFFTPKGLNKSETFIEIGSHIKEFSDYKPKDYTKNIAIGKRFQLAAGNIDKALNCRALSTDRNFEHNWDGDKPNIVDRRELHVADSKGKSYSIPLSAYNYFMKYYNVVPSIRISSTGDAVIVYNADTIVGMIAAKSAQPQIVFGINDIEEFKTELRGIDSDAYDFMTTITKEIEEEEAEEVEGLEEKTEEAIGEGDSTEGLKEELESRIEFLDELLEDAIEENDNQSLVNELETELETLRDLLEDIE